MNENLPPSIPPKHHALERVPMSMRGLLAFVVLAWALEVLDLFLPGNGLDSLGLRPRTLSGLIGIPLMPFLHGGFAHLFSNTFPFLILGWIVRQAEGKQFLRTSVVIVLLGGVGTWLIGSPGVHIGASGLVYGYFGYVMVRAWRERNLIWIITGLVVGFFFGGMIFGIFPKPNQLVSWEGHLSGMAAGAWFAWRRASPSPDMIISSEKS